MSLWPREAAEQEVTAAVHQKDSSTWDRLNYRGITMAPPDRAGFLKSAETMEAYWPTSSTVHFFHDVPSGQSWRERMLARARQLIDTGSFRPHREMRHVEPLGVTTKEYRQTLRELVQDSLKLSSQETHFIYPRQIVALDAQITHMSQALEKTGAALASAQGTIDHLVKAMIGKATGQLLLLDGFVGVVSDTSDEDITVMYNRKDDLDGEPITQEYQPAQFNVQRPPPVMGTSVEAYVFMIEVPSPAQQSAPPASPAPAESSKDRFAGFRQPPLTGDVEM